MPNPMKETAQVRKIEDHFLNPAKRSQHFDPQNTRQIVIDEAAREVELAFSSETPVGRWFGDEILDHNPESIDLSRLMTGGALLMDHDVRDQVGVVVKVWVDSDRVARARVRFGRSARATEIFNDVVDGIRTNISVGYFVQDYRFEGETDGVESYRVTRWQPYEISFVSVPADPSVGVGRSFPAEAPASDTREAEVPESVTPDASPESAEVSETTEATPEETPKEERNMTTPVDQIAQERARVKDLREIGKRFDSMDLAERCIDDGSGVDKLNALILEKRGFDMKQNTQSAERTTELGLSDADVQKYSFVRLLNALANPTDAEAQRAAEYELGLSKQVAKKLNRTAKGAFVPFEVLSAQRAHTVGSPTAGGNLVNTDLKTDSFIEMLRNALAIQGAGATVLTGLEGNLAIPRQTGGAAAFWLAENGQPSESSATFDQLAMTPKTVGAYTELSRRALMQPSIDMENFVKSELVKTLAMEIDRVALNGSGTANQPRGILQTAGIGSVVGGTNGAAPTIKHIIDLETSVADSNADVGSMKYLTNARVRGKLKQTEVFTGSGTTVWQAGNTLNGYDTIVSNQVPKTGTKGTSTNVCSTILFGNFADLVIGMWGSLDLQVNPYSLDTAGAVRITAFQDVDCLVRQPASFAAITDVLTA